ncbi:PTS sugar transporter subunit IIA [uncultured Ilyobacter sp.]|uniref:PTS sugar transporter subunit IIA n=1 Tax=uncultured Ilyobacter sp. TaxID=544433 RepID=UPI0029C63A77|nr:PTS sugar transporter subunit IIA [uncultured Ilyobacter sp.]
MLNGQIKIKERVKDWEEAVRLSASSLLENNKIEQRYIDCMVNNIVENGPYMIILPGVAMPHSRPEDGVIATGLSLLKLNEEVSFPEDNRVKLVFSLAAGDSDSHMDTIMSLCDLFEDETKIEALNNATSIEEILEII